MPCACENDRSGHLGTQFEVHRARATRCACQSDRSGHLGTQFAGWGTLVGMDAYDAIITKRDTRSYLPDPVEADLLDRVLRAARMAGSAKNAQLTRLVVVQDPATREALTRCGDFTAWIASAPVVIVLVAPVDGGRLFDLGRMAQNLMVAANGLGLATCPVTFHHQDRLRPTLGLPDDMEGPMAVTLGHPGPTDDASPRAPRIALDDLVHRERWRD
jgi:nitroreductase